MGIIRFGRTKSFEKINVQWFEWLKVFRFVMVIQRGEKMRPLLNANTNKIICKVP
jgi:hypothetical protein